jgi:hypothetical protein
MLNESFLKIGNVDARCGADVFLEILLSKGVQYILVGKRQEGPG